MTASFQLGRADPGMSFMGRGVTRAAAMSLCHLAQEMGQLSRELDNASTDPDQVNFTLGESIM